MALSSSIHRYPVRMHVSADVLQPEHNREQATVGGTTGNNTIVAPGPNATLTGNGGNDTFVFLQTLAKLPSQITYGTDAIRQSY